MTQCLFAGKHVNYFFCKKKVFKSYFRQEIRGVKLPATRKIFHLISLILRNLTFLKVNSLKTDSCLFSDRIQTRYADSGMQLSDWNSSPFPVKKRGILKKSPENWLILQANN